MSDDASFTIDIPVTGQPGLDAAASSVDVLAANLDTSSKATLAAAEASTEGAAALDKLADAAKGAGDDAGDGGIKIETLERGLRKLGGPLGAAGAQVAGLGSGWKKLSSQLGDAAPMAVAALGIAAVVVAMAALVEKTIEGIAKILEWGVGLADANRSALLLSQGIARSTAGGAMLNSEIDHLNKTLPLSREELSSISQRLADSGLRGQALSDALDKAAVAAAKLKFGPDFQKEMLSLNEQSKVFQANIAATFGGLKTDALMEGLQKLVALFDSDTAAGKAMKVVFESIFQPLVDWITAATPKIERFFLEFEILVLKAMIAIKPWGSTILKVIEVFGIGAAVIAGVFGVAILAVIGFMVAFMAPILAAIAGVAWLVSELFKAGAAIIGFFQGLNLGDMASKLIDGLVEGLKGGALKVINAIKGVVGGAIDAGKKMLGIASPSKVFADIGMQTGAGMSQGVERSSGGVQDSLESMVSPPTAAKPAAPAASPAPGAAKGGGLSGVIFNFYGVEGAQDAESRFAEALTRVLEGDAAQMGAVAPG